MYLHLCYDATMPATTTTTVLKVQKKQSLQVLLTNVYRCIRQTASEQWPHKTHTLNKDKQQGRLLFT